MGDSGRRYPAINADVGDGFFDTPDAATIFLNRQARATDLPRTALAAQLRHKFEYLAQACRADRMALGLKAT